MCCEIVRDVQLRLLSTVSESVCAVRLSGTSSCACASMSSVAMHLPRTVSESERAVGL